MRDERNPYGARGGYIDKYNKDYEMDERRGYSRDRDYDMRRDYDYAMRRDYDMRPFDVRGYYDGHDKQYLDERELERWSKKLMREIEEKDKQFFKMENIIKRAENMSIKFEEFTPDEFYVTVLMVFTDFSKALGTVNPDIFIKLANHWLCDEDSGLQYGEKLAAYYYHIVEA